MDSLTLITSKKYKTIGELLKSPIKSIILVSNNEKNEDIRSYLYDLLQGYIVNYDISYITKDQMVNYLRFLTK